MMDPRRAQPAAWPGCVLAVATRAPAQQLKLNPHLHHNRGGEPSVELLSGILDSALKQQQAATQPTREEWH